MSLGYGQGSFSCCSAWAGVGHTRTAQSSPSGAVLEVCARWGHVLEQGMPAGTTARVALLAQVELSHSTLVTLWFVQSVRAPPGHEFIACSGKVHGAQLGPWCSTQLSSLKAASLVFSARVCQEHLCSFKRLAPRFFCFTPATTQAGSGSCWQVRAVTT